MPKPGTVIQGYVDRAFGRFAALRPAGDPPLTPWTPPPAAGLALVKQHLADHYDVPVRKLAVLDCGVYRVDRADGSCWVARVFSPARALAAVKGDVEILRFLAAHDYPAERLADDDPISVVDGHGVIVTQFVKGKPPAGTAAAGAWVGDALGRLHALPQKGVPKRAGGGWHSLSLDGGGRAADLAVLFTLFDDLRRVVPADHRKHVEALRGALSELDHCEGMPQALVHVDFGGPNVLKSSDGKYTVIDWTGAGRGPRIECVAAALGPLPPAAQRAAIKAYREHVQPTEEELDRLEGTLLTHQLVLACWGAALMPAQVPGLAAQLPHAATAMAARATQMRKAFAA